MFVLPRFFQKKRKRTMIERHIFPFSGLIGQEKMETGLLLNAVDPGIGGAGNSCKGLSEKAADRDGYFS